MTEDNVEANVKNYSVVKSLWQPWWLLADKINDFVKIGGLFALIITVLSFVFGQAYFCLFKNDYMPGVLCQNNGFWYLMYLALKLMILSMFIKVWFDKEILNMNFSLKQEVQNKLKYCKVFGWFILFILLNSLPAVSGVVLLLRVPNPVWQIELAFFTFVFIGFLVPFVVMRFYALIPDLLEQKGFKNIKQIWKNTAGCGLKTVFASSITFFICLFLFLSVTSVFKGNSLINPYVGNFFADLIFNFVTLFILALFVGFTAVQRQMILKQENSGI